LIGNGSNLRHVTAPYPNGARTQLNSFQLHLEVQPNGFIGFSSTKKVSGAKEMNLGIDSSTTSLYTLFLKLNLKVTLIE
jgi:CRISPR/Cas system-associated protein Cas7 (RAMP superfamily)